MVIIIKHITKRVMDIAQYIIQSTATVSQTAKVFGVSKSTVHTELLKMGN